MMIQFMCSPCSSYGAGTGRRVYLVSPVCRLNLSLEGSLSVAFTVRFFRQILVAAVLQNHGSLYIPLSPRYLRTCSRCTQGNQDAHREHGREVTENKIKSPYSPTYQTHLSFANVILPKLFHAHKPHLPPFSTCESVSYRITGNEQLRDNKKKFVLTRSQIFILSPS